MRFQFGFFFLIVSVVLCCAAPASGQVPDAEGHCVAIVCPGGREIPCDSSCSSSESGSSGPSYSGPSAAEIAAERAREEEQRRLEGLQRQAEQERLEREAEQKRAQEEFLMEVRKAAGDLKGVSHSDMGLKGVGGSDPFSGLKGVSPGVSPSEAGANMNTARPDASSRDVSTASKQLTCAANITTYALKHVSNIVSGTGAATDFDEIKYLAGEAANALQGDPVGVECKSNDTLKFTKPPDLKTIAPAYKAALDNMVRDSGKLYESQQQAAAAQQKVDEAKKHVDELKSQKAAQIAQAQRPSTSPPPTKPAQSSGDPVVDKAYAEQKAWQQEDQDKINQIAAEQKNLRQQQFDALALLRKAQAELNAVNSQKVATTEALTADVKKTRDALASTVPQQ
jgi:hypothetical protein